MQEDKKEFGKWWVWVLLLVVVTVIVIAGLNYAGVIGRTAVEREVFEQSYQKQAWDRARIETYKAEKALMEGRLRSNSLTEEQKAEYEARLLAIEIQLRAARGVQ